MQNNFNLINSFIQQMYIISSNLFRGYGGEYGLYKGRWSDMKKVLHRTQKCASYYSKKKAFRENKL